MNRTYWHRQTVDKPLFPDLIWSRPENKAHAGKLLIIGGNSFGFSAVGEAYTAAVAAGAGSTRVVLPEAIRKVAGHVLEHAEFAASNPSGGFSKDALGEVLAQASWADGVLLAGDFGRNSETGILLEQFLQKYSGQLTVSKDALDYFLENPLALFNRPETTLVVAMGQLQKLVQSLKHPVAVTSSMDFLKLVDVLHELTNQYNVHLITKLHDQIIVACDGQVSSTKLNDDLQIWRTKIAAGATVWWLQNSEKAFDAMTTSVLPK